MVKLSAIINLYQIVTDLMSLLLHGVRPLSVSDLDLGSGPCLSSRAAAGAERASRWLVADDLGAELPSDPLDLLRHLDLQLGRLLLQAIHSGAHLLELLLELEDA